MAAPPRVALRPGSRPNRYRAWRDLLTRSGMKPELHLDDATINSAIATDFEVPCSADVTSASRSDEYSCACTPDHASCLRNTNPVWRRRISQPPRVGSRRSARQEAETRPGFTTRLPGLGIRWEDTP